MGVIELGLVTDHEESATEPPARRLGSPREIRRALIAACALLCLLLVTGSAPPRSSGPAVLWSIPMAGGSDSFIVADEHVYILSGSTALEQRRLSAYGIRTGKMLWTTTGLDDSAWIGAVESGVIMLPTGQVTTEFDTTEGGVGFREFNRETIAIDAANGQQLWRLPGEFAGSNGQQALLTEWDDQGVTARTLRAVGLHTGALTWENTTAGVQSWAMGDDPGQFVTATGDGEVRVLSIADGTAVISEKLPWIGRTESGDQSTDITIDSNLLIVRNVNTSKATITAYDLSTLTPRWNFTNESFNGFYRCEPIMCLNDKDGISGYEPSTGQRLWQRASGGWAAPLGANRLILEDGQEAVRHAIIDSRTGTTLADLGTATVVWSYSDPTAISSAYVLIRTTQPPGRTALGEVNNTTGEIMLRGLVDDVQDYGCHASGTLLLCATAGNRLTVTEAGSLTAAG